MTRATVAYAPPGIFGQMWQNLITDATLTAAQRTCLSAALCMADLARADDTAMGGTAVRDHNWYRVAVAAYTHLNDTRAYRLADTGLPRSPRPCRADPARIRSWLRTPTNAGSVAESLGITNGFDVDDPELLTIVENLVRQAQRAGVFGVPGYTIHAHPVADVDTQPDAHIITLGSPAGFALATNPIPPERLLDPGLAGVDAAVGVLAGVAAAVEKLRHGWTLVAVTASITATPSTPARPRA